MTQNYLDLRAATQARDRSLRAKVMTLEKATEIVQDGDHIAIGGCTASRQLNSDGIRLRKLSQNLKIQK